MSEWNKYGQIAVNATELVRGRGQPSATQAWDAAARDVFPDLEDARTKSCPKCAYLGLCEDGLVVGVPSGDYLRRRDNKGYAVAAVQLLRREPRLAGQPPRALWRRVMDGRAKQYNSQMHVVLALWAKGLIAPVGDQTPPA